jgi:predicted nucleic acid-binding protein
VIFYFLDSSAVVKRYVTETGTPWIKSIVNPLSGNYIHVARITGAEVVSALSRRMRGGSITAAAGSAAIGEFRNHFASEYVTVDITPSVIERAIDLAETYALRGYDAVQLAAVLEVNTDSIALGMGSPTLISADGDLNAAATAEGLAIDDPNTHS